MIDLSVAFRIVVGALDHVGVPYVVVGSTAAATWGVLRATRGIDVVAIVDDYEGDALIACLGQQDVYVPIDDAADAVANGGTFDVLHPRSGGKVDVFVRRPDDDFARSRLERRVPAELLGVDAWVATPEDVVLAKLQLRLESRSEVQRRDCVEIAATQSLDRDTYGRGASRLGVTEDLGELLEQ